jgi:ankyrin repeat protein
MMSWILISSPINLWTDPSISRGLMATSFVGPRTPEQPRAVDLDVDAFRESVRAGDLESVEAGLDDGIDPARGLSTAVRSNQPAVLSLLVSRGASGPAAARALAWARTLDSEESARILEAAGIDIDLANDRGETALVLAARSGNVDELRLLLGNGADPDAATNTGLTALMEVAASGNAEIVSILVGVGADLDAVDRDGWTALLAGVRAGRDEVVLALVEAGADIDRASELGWTPLLSAAYAGDLDLVVALVEVGADVNFSSTAGGSALIRAAQQGYPEIVRILLGAGADAAQSIGGVDALRWARLGGHEEVVAELEGWAR